MSESSYPRDLLLAFCESCFPGVRSQGSVLTALYSVHEAMFTFVEQKQTNRLPSARLAYTATDCHTGRWPSTAGRGMQNPSRRKHTHQETPEYAMGSF
jgi:hypothetical protein